MRFLMLNWRDPKNPSSGGAERVSVAYMEGLLARGHQVSWFSNHFPNAKSEENINGIQVVRGGGAGSSILKARVWYRQQPKFDLVIDQHHGLPWFAPWWSGTRCVAYIHEVLGPIWGAFYPWPVSTFGRLQESATHWLYRNTQFWTVSESTRKQLLENGVKNATVIPNGTDLQAIAELEPKSISQPVRLICVSRLFPNKRIDHAVRVLKSLEARKVNAALTIVGTGGSEPALRQLAVELGVSSKITFTGHVSEGQKNELLRAAHLLIHTSIREGWGLNVIEANCMGTPAVVYPVGGLVDSTVDGVTGIVTPVESPDAVADAVVKILGHAGLYEKYRQAAWERSKTFHWRHVLKLGCDFLESMARPAKSS